MRMRVERAAGSKSHRASEARALGNAMGTFRAAGDMILFVFLKICPGCGVWQNGRAVCQERDWVMGTWVVAMRWRDMVDIFGRWS